MGRLVGACILCGIFSSVLTAQGTANKSRPPTTAPSASRQQAPEFDDGTLTSFALIAENDVIFQLGHNQDRNYTGGFGFQFSGSFVRKAHIHQPLQALDRLTRFQHFHGRSDKRYYSLLLVGTGFTPDSLNTRDPLPEDRPYGSILALTVRRLTVNEETFDEAWSSELAVGVLGLHIARNLQTWLHRRLRARSGEPTPYDPLGWGNQVSDGGEPTALYRVGYERRVAGDASGRDIRKNFQVVGGGQASAGYYTNATVLTSARLGSFTSDFWEFSPSATNVATQNLGTGRHRTPKWEAFLFAAARPRLVIYNALLQGQFKESIHTFSAGDVKRLQLEWELGVAAFAPVWKGGVQLVWNAFSGRTAEFTADESRTHTWGSGLLVLSFPVQ
jgi:hypothetical protein